MKDPLLQQFVMSAGEALRIHGRLGVGNFYVNGKMIGGKMIGAGVDVRLVGGRRVVRNRSEAGRTALR